MWRTWLSVGWYVRTQKSDVPSWVPPHYFFLGERGQYCRGEQPENVLTNTCINRVSLLLLIALWYSKYKNTFFT
jgi:hypothetical protein